jgi:antitoxin MazE
MKTKVQKWGNSLAVRIPKPYADEVRLAEDSTVEVSVRNGKLMVAPLPEPQFTLEELVRQITPGNCHTEIEEDLPVGREIW